MTFIIAEAGINHGGSLERAKRLVEEAAAAGADAVKFQLYNAERMCPPGKDRDLLERCHLSHTQLQQLMWHIGDRRIGFLCTPFDDESAQFLIDDLGLDTIKIASGHLDNERLLKVASRAKHVILSTGMANMGLVDEALKTLGRNPTVSLLHCVSAYPCPPSDANLMAMSTLRLAFGRRVGLSDHTTGIWAPIAAVALGAEIIEKHIALDDKGLCPDEKVSLKPAEFRAMVDAVRATERGLGNGRKNVAPSEAATIKTVKRRREYSEKPV